MVGPGYEAIISSAVVLQIHLFDLRADQKVKCYTKPSILFGASALDFSKSGESLGSGAGELPLIAGSPLILLFVSLFNLQGVSSLVATMISPSEGGMC